MDQIDIIVPCFNEENVLELFYEKVKKYMTDIPDCSMRCVFVNDGSSDGTLEKMRELAKANADVTYISLSRNFGKEAAMMAALDYVDGDAVVIMDADLQHPPDLLPEMVDWWRHGYDDVCGKRTGREDESWLKRTGADVFYRFVQRISDYPVQRDVGDFRLLDRRCVMALRLLRENQRFTKGLFSWVGFRKKEIPFQVRERAAGSTKWNYFSLFGFAIRGMTSFTTLPLRFISLLGVAVSISSILYMVFVLTVALLYGDPVAGYPTLMTVMLFLGGIQLLTLGIIGEYVGQIFNESKRRPIYLIDEVNGERVACVGDVKSIWRK